MQGQETIAIVVIAAIVVLLLIWLYLQKRRTDALRAQYGEEYERTLEAKGRRADAEADLIDREKRVKELEIRPLTAQEHSRFAAEWTEAKALFVDSPVEAVSRGDRLLTTIMHTRGYPMADFEQRHADLTVGHAAVAKDYLAGHEIAARSSEATTEELRRAFNHFDALFVEMTREVANTVDNSAPATAREGDGNADEAQRDTAPVRSAAFSTTTTRPED